MFALPLGQGANNFGKSAAAAKTKYHTDEELRDADAKAFLDDQRTKSPELWKKLQQSTSVLMSSTPDHERDLFADDADDQVPPPPRTWSPEPRQKHGVKPCPYAPGTKVSQVSGCWLDPKCQAYIRNGARNFANYRKHQVQEHLPTTPKNQWLFGWTIFWIDVEGRKEERVLRNGIEIPIA